MEEDNTQYYNEEWNDKLERYKKEDRERHQEYLNKKSILEMNRMLGPLINNLNSQGLISEEDYIKWILSQDQNFIPKLINK